MMSDGMVTLFDTNVHLKISELTFDPTGVWVLKKFWVAPVAAVGSVVPLANPRNVPSVPVTN
jgi:hypothetical protein